MSGRWILVERGTTILALVAAVAVLSKQFQPAASARHSFEIPSRPIVMTPGPSLGSAEATRAVIIFSDFQCPFCKKFAQETWPLIKKEFVDPGRLFVAFRNLPLPNHSFAQKAAQAAECAEKQGRFWEMHDKLFSSPLDDTAIRTAAGSIGLDTNVWEACQSGGVQARVDEDRRLAIELGVQSTPFFLFGVREADGKLRATSWVTGAQPLDTFRASVERALK